MWKLTTLINLFGLMLEAEGIAFAFPVSIVCSLVLFLFYLQYKPLSFLNNLEAIKTVSLKNNIDKDSLVNTQAIIHCIYGILVCSIIIGALGVENLWMAVAYACYRGFRTTTFLKQYSKIVNSSE